MMARGSLALSLVAVLVAACSGKDPYNPGTALGTFHVSSKLVSSTCGAVPDPWEFDVRLSHDRSTLYWIQGGAPIQGNVASDSTAELSASATQEVRPADAKRKTAGCAMTRDDALSVALTGADQKPAAVELTMGFSGTLTYRFTVTQDSDCSSELSESGGDFDALPCEVHYEVTGARTKAPDAR